MVRFFNWWGTDNSSDNIQDHWFKEFFERCCADFVDADHQKICLYTVFGSPYVLTQTDKSCANIFFTGENTNVMHTQYADELQFARYMDAVCSFFTKTPKSIRFPLWLTYWRFQTDGLFKIPSTSGRNGKAIIVSNHSANGLRTHVVEALQTYDIEIECNRADVFPMCKQVDVGSGSRGKIETLKSYKYNICCENSLSEGYTTEKLFEALAGGCVPIYFGNDPVEPKVLQQQNIVFITKMNPQDITNRTLDHTNVWTPDALVHIYATYLQLWSVVKLKLGIKKMKETNTMFVDYECTSKEDAMEKLVIHWKHFSNFFTPRAKFHLEGQTYFMEDFAGDMYEKYRI